MQYEIDNATDDVLLPTMLTLNLNEPAELNFNLQEIKEIGEYNEKSIKQTQKVEHFMRKLIWTLRMLFKKKRWVYRGKNSPRETKNDLTMHTVYDLTLNSCLGRKVSLA